MDLGRGFNSDMGSRLDTLKMGSSRKTVGGPPLAAPVALSVFAGGGTGSSAPRTASIAAAAVSTVANCAHA